MNRAHRLLGLSLLAVIFSGCGSGFEHEPIDQTSQAINVCDEAVPAERYIDGFPAYAQCDAFEESEIWSNNGVDTAASSQGPDWVRTQYSGGYQCTELARRYFLFRWDVDYQNGNAGEWCDGDLPDTLTISATPVHGDLIVFEGGVCGAAQSTGHIAVVDEVDAAQAEVTIIEQNRASRRTTDQSCALCFLHVIANDGSVGTGGTPGTGGTSGAGGTSDAGSTGGLPAAGGSMGTAGSPSGSGSGGASAAGSTGVGVAGATQSSAGGSQAGAGMPTTPPSVPLTEDVSDTTVEGTCGIATGARGSKTSWLALACSALGALFGRRRPLRSVTTRPRA